MCVLPKYPGQLRVQQLVIYILHWLFTVGKSQKQEKHETKINKIWAFLQSKRREFFCEHLHLFYTFSIWFWFKTPYLLTWNPTAAPGAQYRCRRLAWLIESPISRPLCTSTPVANPVIGKAYNSVSQTGCRDTFVCRQNPPLCSQINPVSYLRWKSLYNYHLANVFRLFLFQSERLLL
jgi:hypothetical protein